MARIVMTTVFPSENVWMIRRPVSGWRPPGSPDAGAPVSSVVVAE